MTQSDERTRALDKIRKCLALSESSNENESAAAMRQAQALMKKYGLSSSDMSIFEVKEALIKIKYKAPPEWFQHLGAVVAIAFGCSLFTKWHHFIFVGPSACSEVAGYSLEVLRNQCEANKKRFLAKEMFVGVSPATKRKLGQSFCEGFVRGIYVAIHEFASAVTDEQHQKHTNYLSTLVDAPIGQKKEKKKKETSDPVKDWALAHGQVSGQKVKLHAGVAAGEQLLKIGNQS